MAIVTRIVGRCVDLIVSLTPARVRAKLANRIAARLPDSDIERLVWRLTKHPARGSNKSPRRPWEQLSIPTQVRDFHDLAFLFSCCPSNRRVIRMDFDEAALLYRIASQPTMRRAVEIGRHNGGSTVLLSVAIPVDGQLLSIDISPADDAALQSVLQKIGSNHKVRLLVADANSVAYCEPLDFVFIDGDHSYEGAKRDHLKWGALVRRGGFIVHHDMAKTRVSASQVRGVLRLREEILTHQSQDIVLREEVGSLSVFRRVSDTWYQF